MGRDSSFIFLIGAVKMSDILSGHGTWKSELEGRSPISSAWFLSIWVLITRTRPEEGITSLEARRSSVSRREGGSEEPTACSGNSYPPWATAKAIF